MRYQAVLKVHNLFVLYGQVFYDLNTGDYNPDSGYMVTDPETTRKFKDLDVQSLINYLSEFKRKIKDGVYLSIFYNLNDDIEVEFANLIQDEKHAEFIGHARSLDAIWDNTKQTYYEISESI